MKARGQFQRQEDFGAGWAAHALGVEVSDTDNLEPLFAGNDGIGRGGKTAVCSTKRPVGRRGLCRASSTLRVAHCQFFAQERLRKIDDFDLIHSSARSLA